MNILITGAKGFVGKNLVENLKNIRDGKNNTRPNIHVEKIYEYDLNNTLDELEEFCKNADFIFNFAGVNRPQNVEEYKKGNYEFVSQLLEYLKKYNNKAPIMLSSSIQASLEGRFGISEYGLSKKAGEELFFKYGESTGAKVLVYRFPNLVGKWIKPNYNSAIATFCNNIANDLPIRIDNPETEIEMLFIDDLITEMFDALEGKEHHCEFDGNIARLTHDGRYCCAPTTYRSTLGEIVELLYTFCNQSETLIIPAIPNNSYVKKLYSTYLSYLPKEKIVYDLKMNCDDRGSFTELLKTVDHGQFSLNISRPGVTKGEHWHNSKWEFFIVVSGHGLIQERKIGSEDILEFKVSGEKIQVVHMLPGYVHNIVNLSDSENLVTLMWANEIFDRFNPDTFFENVKYD
jgi:UDP-2-acetamido-2,6-beta-L-arabino-hexul-4-ose reductase